MEIKIQINKRYGAIVKENYLSAQVYINGKWFKEVIPDYTEDVNKILELVTDSLVNREELEYSEYKRNDHDKDCDCQYNPNYEVKIGARLASESCPVHNHNPIDPDDQLK